MKKILTEQQEQTKIKNFCESKWFIVLNLIKVTPSWFADLLVLTWNWKHFWVEVKKKSWWFTYPIQKYRKKQLEEHWDISMIARWFEDFINQYKELWKTQE